MYHLKRLKRILKLKNVVSYKKDKMTYLNCLQSDRFFSILYERSCKLSKYILCQYKTDESIELTKQLDPDYDWRIIHRELNN
jgi:hypothetical protein